MKTPEEFEEKIAYLESASFEEVAQFIKRRKKTYRRAALQTPFWTSALLARWAAQLLDLPYAIDFLLDYFKQSDTNPGFLQEAVKAKPKLMERVIKLSKAYEAAEHWQSMEFLKRHEDTRLRILYKELIYIRRLNEHWKEKSRFYEGVISALDYEDILIHTASYFERFKRGEQTISDQSRITSHELHYCRVLNHILNIKRESQLDTAVANKYELSAFNQKASDAMPPINPAEGVIQGKYLPNESINPEKKLIREVIDFYFCYLSTQYQIEKYLCGYADFETIDGLEAELKTNKEFAIHWRNDKKSIFQETLALNKALAKITANSNKVSLSRLRIEQPIESSIESWEYLCLPKHIKSNYEEEKEDIDVEAVLKFLINFAIDPTLEAYNFDSTDSKNTKDLYAKLSPYILINGEEKLVQVTTTYYPWDRNTTESLLDFLTTDLNSPSTTIDILSRPLIKIGTQHIWLSSLMKDRRWDTLMHRRVAQESLFSHQKQSADMEKGLAKSFLDAAFKAIPGWKYNHGKEGGGEIDTLAFKDKTLFVLELKTSFLDEDLLTSNKYRELRFDFKASDQLSNHLEYIEGNFESFRSEIPELSIDCDWEELTITPLIVSNIFEFDDQLISEQYRKISLFELQVILRNDLYDALHNRMGSYLPNGVGDTPVANIFQNYNQRNPQFKNEQIAPQDKAYYNLWSSPDACSPQDILSAIEERKVWQGLDGMMKFASGERIMIGGVE